MVHDFRSGYVRRVVDDELDQLLPHLPALMLDGPKGVGKTCTAEQRAETVFRLSRPAVAELATADPEQVLSAPPPILLDEYQRVPELWDEVKEHVDRDSTPARVLLTGSAPPAGTHSGAGRIAMIRMRPLTLPERGVCQPTVSLAELFAGDADISGVSDLRLAAYTELILSSGFPGLQHLSGRALTTQLDGYIERIITRDIPEAGHRVSRPATLHAWLRAYAASISTSTSWEKIRDAAHPGQAAKPARSTTIPYVDVLRDLRILDDIPAWAPGHNHLKRLGLAPKHHLADPALAARLTGVTASSLLIGAANDFTPNDGSYLGQLFESLAALTVRTFSGPIGVSVSHLRQNAGAHEIDLIAERGDDRAIVAFEVKLSSRVNDRDVRHLRWLQQNLGAQLVDAVVITTGRQAYRRTSDGIAVVPLGLLGP